MNVPFRKPTQVSLISATAPLSSNALAMKRATSAFHTWECDGKSQVSLLSCSQNKGFGKFSLSVPQPDLQNFCFVSTDKERVRQQRGARFPPEEDLHADSCWGGTETGAAGEIHAGWYGSRLGSAFFSRLRSDLSCAWIDFPALLAVVFVRFEFSSLAVYLESSPPLSLKCLHSNQSGVFSGHKRGFFVLFFFWKELMILQKASSKTKGIQVWAGWRQTRRTNTWISIIGSSAEGLF